MKYMESSLLERSLQIHLESSDFIDACEKHLKKSKEFSDSTSYFVEEAMIHIEEAIANKAKSLTILKLTTKMPNLAAQVSIVEETKLTLKMLANIKQAPIPDKSPALQDLRSRLIELSFLPISVTEASLQQ
jgi:hypothetical protein